MQNILQKIYVEPGFNNTWDEKKSLHEKIF